MTRRLPLLLVLVAAIAYPLATLAGGSPQFPKRSDCVHPAKTDGDIEAVFGGRFARQPDAEAELQRAQRAGFTLAELTGDGCGLVKVFVPGIPTLATGRDLIAEAKRVGLHVTLEKSV